MARCMSCERNYDAGRCSLCLVDRAEKAESERDAATSKLYAIINTTGADCIRKYVGTDIADEIITAERERIESYRGRARKAEADLASTRVARDTAVRGYAAAAAEVARLRAALVAVQQKAGEYCSCTNADVDIDDMITDVLRGGTS